MNSVAYSIKCPRCSQEATAQMRPGGTKRTYREVLVKMVASRITCRTCGFSKVVPPNDSDAYELWYATTFKGHRLWAHNRQHLVFLISWFSGEIREQDVSVGDRAVVESFPKWMILGQHRSAILKCLNQMLTRDANKRLQRTGASRLARVGNRTSPAAGCRR